MTPEQIAAKLAELRAEREKALAQLNFIAGMIAAFEMMQAEQPPAEPAE